MVSSAREECVVNVVMVKGDASAVNTVARDVIGVVDIVNGHGLAQQGYHTLLPVYLQDVLKGAVDDSGGEERFEQVRYVGQLDRAIRRVREGFPQAFNKMGW